MRSWGLFFLCLLVPACTVPSTHVDLDAFFADTATIDGGRDGGMDAGRDAARMPDVGMDGAFDADAAHVAADAGRPCMPEVCSNGLDDDCNGLVDDGCSCVPGDTMACFRGAPTHRGLGLCTDGHMVCTGFEFGAWGPCEGDVVEAEDVCDAAGLDEDCDGAPNDGCECSAGDPDLPCGSDVGACERGVQRCLSGMLTACEGAITAAAETCDGTDEDCDGAIDEGLVGYCGSTTGRCRAGISTCTAGAFGPCVGGIGPGTESCDGTDEDCDGTVDEDADRSCGSDVGVCIAGTERCTMSMLAACSGATAPVIETCDGLDQDCDGSVDEMLVRPCGTDTGVCVAGTQTCASGAWGAACAGAVAAGTEACEGALDEDCDGAVDEGCGCTTGTMRPCGTDTGACVRGMQTCAAGAWGACAGAVDPRPELCDGTNDENCDGVVDDGCACTSGATRVCGSDIGECATGIETCAAGRWGTCGGSIGAAAEACNGRDDDCDAAIDEAGICPRMPPLAMCPAPRTTTVGGGVTLVGMGSDPDGGSVSYAWSVVVRPVGSTAAPTTPAGASTDFTPDAPGDYTIRLCITDDESTTTCCTTGVTASSTCTAPTTPTASACGTSWDRRPIVELTPLPSGVVYELFLDGASSPYGVVATTGQNYFRPPAAIAAGGPVPGTHATIAVRACSAADRTCCSGPTSVSVSLVEACTTPRAPTMGDVVFSEYVIDGDGACPGASCEAGEAFEITNLTNCPLTLAGDHFFYCNGSCASGSYRWMNFGPEDVIPPRGVYVAIRAQAMSMCSYPFFGADDPSLFGLHVSTLAMQPPGSLASGWFVNTGGGNLRLATGASTMMPGAGTTLGSRTYSSAPAECQSAGYDALDRCGEFNATSTFGTLSTNQLGRLWHPCDAVLSPMPATCR